MKKTLTNQQYIFVTSVSPNDDDFSIEIYPYNEEEKTDGPPLKVVQNFEELIDFLEKHENE